MYSATEVLMDLAGFVWMASLKTVALIAVVLLLQKLCSTALSATGHYLLWLPVVLSLVMPLGFDTALPLGTVTALSARTTTLTAVTSTAEPASESGVQRSTPVATDAIAAAKTNTLPVVQEPAINFSALATNTASEDARNLPFSDVLRSSVPWLWLAGMLTMLIVIAVSTRRMAALIADATPAPHALQQVLRDCMQLSGCKREVRVLQSADVQAPMIAGLFNPVLLLPSGMEQQLDNPQLRHVFLHELTHLQRGDILINWIVALVQALHWFNPVVWYAFYRLRQDRELACDAVTLRLLQPAERASYGHTLLRLHDLLPNQPVPALALGMLESANHLQRRIHMLVQGPRNPRLQRTLAALLALPLAAAVFSQPAPATRAVPAAPLAAPAELVAVPESIAVEPVVATQPAPAPTAPAVTVAAPVVGEPPVAEAAPASTRPVAIQTAEATEVAEPEQAVVTPAPQPLQLAQIEPSAISANPASDMPAATALTRPTMLQTSAIEEAASDFADATLIQELADHLADVKADRLQFINKWEDMGNTCDARKDSWFGALSASCQRIRTALQRGDILGLSYECYVLGTVHTEQQTRYRAAGLDEPTLINIDALLQSNEQALAEICSKDTYSAEYPAFAAIVADAESPKYRNMQSIRMMQVPAWQLGMAWGDIMMNSTSMVSIFPTSPYTSPAPETYYNAYAGQGAMDGGMASGGNTGGASVDPGAVAPAP